MSQNCDCLHYIFLKKENKNITFVFLADEYISSSFAMSWKAIFYSLMVKYQIVVMYVTVDV